MKRSVAVLLLAAVAGCSTSSQAPPETGWYDGAEVACHRPGCPRCAGEGNVGCGPCRAVGWTRCTRCKDGKVKCDTCKGDGSYKGKKCKSCGGDGVETCSACGGDQRIECDVCSGKARLLCLRKIRISEPLPEGSDAWPPTTGQK